MAKAANYEAEMDLSSLHSGASLVLREDHEHSRTGSDQCRTGDLVEI